MRVVPRRYSRVKRFYLLPRSPVAPRCEPFSRTEIGSRTVFWGVRSMDRSQNSSGFWTHLCPRQCLSPRMGKLAALVVSSVLAIGPLAGAIELNLGGAQSPTVNQTPTVNLRRPQIRTLKLALRLSFRSVKNRKLMPPLTTVRSNRSRSMRKSSPNWPTPSPSNRRRAKPKKRRPQLPPANQSKRARRPQRKLIQRRLLPHPLRSLPLKRQRSRPRIPINLPASAT